MSSMLAIAKTSRMPHVHWLGLGLGFGLGLGLGFGLAYSHTLTNSPTTIDGHHPRCAAGRVGAQRGGAR